MRTHRMEVLKISLRVAAKQFGVDASNLSKMERGVIPPRAVYGTIAKNQQHADS